jgi:predicted permease
MKMYQQFLIFFLLLSTGFFCKKYKILNDATTTGVNRFIIMVAYPCLIMARTSSLEMDHRIFANFLFTGVLTVGLLLVFAAFGYFYCRVRKFPAEDAPIAEFSIMSPNNGFMGFPIAFAFFGDMGLLYMVASNVALNTMFFTYGISLMRRGSDKRPESLVKKIVGFLSLLVNPKVSAAIVGIFLCYNHLQLPGLAMTYLESVGAVATPLAMVSIGTMLAEGFGLHVLKDRLIMEPALMKLFAVPLICVAIVCFLPLDPLVKTILIVGNALPTATTVPILAEQYKRNRGLAGSILVVSTIFSMATIPVAVWLLDLAGL